MRPERLRVAVPGVRGGGAGMTVEGRIEWERTVSEEVFQGQVIELARMLGWRVAHFRGARVQRRDGSVRYQTPVQADGAGFPDLVMVRGGRLIVAELKSARGRTRAEQETWLAAFEGVPGCEVYVWRPRDWDALAGVLRAGVWRACGREGGQTRAMAPARAKGRDE